MRRLLLVYMLAVTAMVLIVQSIPLSNFIEQTQLSKVTITLERDAFVLAHRSEEMVLTQTPEQVQRLTNLVDEYSAVGGSQVLIVDSTGRVLVATKGSEESLGATYANRPEVSEALKGTVATGRRFSETLQRDLFFVAVPVLTGEEVIGAVRIAFDAEAIDSQVSGFQQITFLIALITLLVAAALSLLIANIISRPIRRVSEGAKELADGRLGIQVPQDEGPKELRTLAKSFNEMSLQLGSEIERQRQFAADASHQLRTPLTSLRLRLESLEPKVQDLPEAGGQILELREELSRLERIVESLLMLTKIEAVQPVLKPIEAVEIVRDRVEQWRALASESKVELSFHGVESAICLAAENSLEQILDNLVENAIEASPAGSAVSVYVNWSNANVRIEVADQGKGLADKDFEKAFERFWRGNSTHQGTGIGLSIVRELVRQNHGTIELARNSPSGLRVIIEIPGF